MPTAENDATYILEVAWDWDSTDRAVSLPALVGPFTSCDEACRWGDLNVPNGTWACRPVASPYARVTTPARAVTTPDHCPTCGGVFVHTAACPIPPAKTSIDATEETP